MAVSTYPTAYSPIKEPVIFGIDNSGVVEVSINSYYKQLPSTTRSVNVAPYYRGDFEITPLLESGSFNASTIGRVVSASISIDGTASDSVPLLYGDSLPAQDMFLTDLKHRAVADGEIDEVMVYGGSVASLVAFANTQTQSVLTIGSNNSPWVYAFKPSSYAVSGRVTLQLRNSSGEVLDEISYTTTEQRGINVAWLNAYGTIDRAIIYRNTAEISVEKESIYLSGGYSNIDIIAEETITAHTKPLRESDTRAISYILNSDLVWMQENGEWVGIDVTSTSAYVYQDAELSPMEVTFRRKKR